MSVSEIVGLPPTILVRVADTLAPCGLSAEKTGSAILQWAEVEYDTSKSPMHQMRQNNRCSGPTSNWVGSMSEPLERASVGLQISIRESDDVIILDLRGRSTIDGGESEVLSSSLKKLVANGVRKLVLNLANMSQVDSSGVSIIVGTAVSLRAKGGDLKLLCPCGRVLEVLTVFRLLDTIPSFEDENQALASFRPQSYFARP